MYQPTLTISMIMGILLIVSTPLQSIDVKEFYYQNFQQSYATMEPASSNCTEDEFFDEDTQSCEKSNDEDSVVCDMDEEYDPDTQTCYNPESSSPCADDEYLSSSGDCVPKPASQDDPEPEPCADDEFLSQETDECEPLPANQDDPEPESEPKVCADDEFLNNNDECEQFNIADPEAEPCAVGELINGTTGLCEPIVCELGQTANSTTGLCEPIVCELGQTANSTTGLCEPIVCFPDEKINFTTGLCDPPAIRELGQSNESFDFSYSEKFNLTGAVGPKPLIVTDLGSINGNNLSSAVMFTVAGDIGSEPGITTGLGTGNELIHLWTGETLKIFGDAIPGNSPIVKFKWEPINYREPVDLDIINPDVSDTELKANAAPGPKIYETKLTVTDANGMDSSKILRVVVCDGSDADCKIPDGKYVAIKWERTDGTMKYPIAIGDKIKFKIESSPLDPTNPPAWTVPPYLNVLRELAGGTEIELEAHAVGSGDELMVDVTYADGITTGSDRIIMEVLGSERLAPTIEVNQDKVTAKPSERVNFFSTLKQGNPPYLPLKIEWSVESGSSSGDVIPTRPGGPNAYWIVPADSKSQTYKFKAIVTDQSNGANDDKFEVKVISPTTADPKKPNPPPKGGEKGGGGTDKGTPSTKSPNGGSKPSDESKVTPSTMMNVWNEKTSTTTSTVSSNKVIKTIGENCSPLSDTLMLGPNTISPKNFKVLADFDKCRVSDATIILNLPQNPNLKLAAGNFDLPNNIVIIPTKDIKTPTTGNKIIQSDLQTRIIGQDLFSKQMKAITNADGLILWNDSPTNSISLIKDSNGIITAQFTKPTP